MGSTVLDCFSLLLKDSQKLRLNAGVKLLEHLSHEAQENGDSKEINHVLNRLVRGLGSSKISSRKGFYCTFAAHLSMNPNVKIEKIFNIMENELKATGSSSKSETADVHNGRILACGAIIRSGILKNSSVDEQNKVLECLIHSGKQRSYLSFESVSFLVDFINQLENEEMLAPVWPLLEKEICKPFSEQTLDTFYALLVIQNKFPRIITKKTLKRCFGNENIINEESIPDILKVLTNIPRVMCYKHPIFKIFCEKLTGTDYVEKFWMGIDQHFVKPSKSDEHLGVELFTLILDNISTNKSVIPNLLSPNFIKYMLKRFTQNPKHKNDEVAIIFKKGLSQIVQALDKDVKNKLKMSVLNKLIVYPGDFMIEKITGTKILQLIISNLNLDGVRKLSNLFREIASNTKFKEKPDSVSEPWTNNERTYALQLLTVKLMSHHEIVSDHEWRIEQLKFLFNLGLCETPNVGVELVTHFKESFYRALDNKLPKLTDLRTVLNSLITHIDETVFQNSETKLRTPLDEPTTEAWKKMLKLVKKLTKNSKTDENLSAVFHTMNLHMGLQLFSDSEMAISAIDELQSCFEHFKSKKKSIKNDSVVVDEEEPEWGEVVVDLMLSLLSKKSHLLRSLVGCVFPHICPHLTNYSIHQILAVLDVKSGKNPLSTSENGEESDSEAESNNEEENDEGDEEVEDDEENSEEGTIEEESDSDVEESDVEDETVTDRLRLAVSQALGDATMQTDDDDMDVDNINEEEGKRLDESLAAAFRILKENRKSQTKKQEKSAQALTHFRIRVIDLLEIYLETSPSMAVALDMLVPLFTLLEFSIKDPHQKPLEHRIRTCLKKLAAVKKFKSVEDVDQEFLTTCLKALIEKGERSASVCQEMGDKLAECCVFLVRCSQQTCIPVGAISQIFGENLTAFFKKRDCILPAILFKSLLQLCWVGNWDLVPLLVDFAFDESVRSYRRGQALEFLKVFYGNIRTITSDDYKNKRLKIEKKLCVSSTNVLFELGGSQGTENSKVAPSIKIKQKYVCNLLLLLLVVHTRHIPEAWDWAKLGESMACYRSITTLAKDAKSAYNKLAHRIGAPIVSKKPKAEITANGKEESDSDEEISDNEESSKQKETESADKLSKKNDKKRKKNNGKRKDKQKLKKEARELRAKAMSEGLESFDFSSVNMSNGVIDKVIQNGDSQEVNTTEKTKKKRPDLNVSDVPSKKKRNQ